MNANLLRYVGKRLLLSIPVLLGIAVVSFGLMYLAPGDVAQALLGDHATPEAIAQIQQQYNLDKPVWQQFTIWLGRVLRGDLGESFVSHKPVTEVIGQRLMVTVQLGFFAFVIALLGAIPLGVWSAVKRNRWQDHASRIIALTGISIPDFWTGIVLMLAFGVFWPILPPGGYIPLSAGLWPNVKSLLLPSLILGFVNMALITRMLRSGMIETLSQNYILAGRAMGVPERTLTWDDALRNAFIPTLTIIGLSLARLFGGAVMLETVFSLPGIGRLVAESVFNRDLPMIQATLLLIGAAYTFVNIFIDVLYTFIDPRIRH
ncbi:MAG: ABC transporter permease [Caldilineaceae bacterium]|nr:ABC transporter permease [Caldilineaceae bacterium]